MRRSRSIATSSRKIATSKWYSTGTNHRARRSRASWTRRSRWFAARSFATAPTERWCGCRLRSAVGSRRPPTAWFATSRRCIRSWRNISPSRSNEGTRMSSSARVGTVFLMIALVLAGCARTPEAKKARYLERGNRYFKQEQYREAILEYRNVLRIDPKEPAATRQLGLAYYQLGQYGLSFRYLTQAQQVDPDNTDVRLKLASIYVLGGRPDDATSQVEEVLKKDTGNLDALVLFAGAANSPREIEDALARIKAVEPTLGGTAKLHLAMAGLYLRKQDPASAEREFREAVAREPKSVEGHVALGNFFVSKRDMGEAEREFRTAAELAPVGSPARVRLADFYLLMRRPEDARQILKQSTEKAPDSLPAWRLLAQLDFAEGKLPDAIN